MGRSRRGKRDGTGPYRGSYMYKKHGTGRRRRAGQPCPKRRKK